MLTKSGAAGLAHIRQARGAPPWQLRSVPVCSSTEQLLTHWLQTNPWSGSCPRAVTARRQICGVGQRGRHWHSPPGGVWLSAALPWSGHGSAPALLGLAVALALAERLEGDGLNVSIKWPNDLLVNGRKLAGILPRMVHRGHRVRLARVGVGLNVVNAVPPGAIALAECGLVLPSGPRSTLLWTAELLDCLDRALLLVQQPREVCRATESRLWCGEVQDPQNGERWSVEGLGEDGALLLRQGTRTCRWTRWADPENAGL